MSYTAVPMGLEHRAAVLHLWKDNMSDPRIASVLEERYRWLYEENPEGPARTVVAVHQAKGDVVGCGSAYPRRMYLNRVELTAGVPSDFAVARTHRIGGAAVAIQRALVEGEPSDYAMYLAFPNRHSLPIFRRLGYKPMAEARAWIKPLRAGYKVRTKIRNGALAAVAAAPIDLWLAAADRVRGLRHRRAVTETVSRADARFDRLWNRARDGYVLAGERSSAYLNWRYADFKTDAYRFFCVCDPESKELSGYVVFRINDKKVFIADLFAADMGAAAEQVLNRFSRAMRGLGCDSVFLAYAGNPAFTGILGRHGFFRGSGAPRQLLVFARGLTAEQERAVMDPANWFMFDGEMDI